MSGPDYSRAGANRERRPSVLSVAPIAPSDITGATEDGIAVLTGDAAAMSALLSLGALAQAEDDTDVPVDTTGLLHVTGSTLRTVIASIDAVLESIINP